MDGNWIGGHYELFAINEGERKRKEVVVVTNKGFLSNLRFITNQFLRLDKQGNEKRLVRALRRMYSFKDKQVFPL